MIIMEGIQGGAQEPAEFSPIRLVFIGQDDDIGGWAWRVEGEKSTRVWKGRDMRARLPGGIYTVEAVTHEGGSLSVRSSTLRYTGEMAEDAALLQAREAKAEAKRRAKALERNTSKTAAIDEALAPLLALAAPLGWSDRETLANLVRDRILRGK